MSKKGFTLIELLVVVAIIGILASIVLVSLNSARAKGRDASAKGSMSSIRAAAEIYYDNNNGSYTDVCVGGSSTDIGVQSLFDAAAAETGIPVICESNSTSWAASVLLNNEFVFCVDSTGFAGDFFSSGTQVDGIGLEADGNFTCISS